MTVYLNSIEFGDGIYGCEAAAQHYFGKPAEKLNRREAALLAAVLPNPIIYRADKTLQNGTRQTGMDSQSDAYVEERY
jgi:monofunctional biosynthetic peptidoglycan transglycosylase